MRKLPFLLALLFLAGCAHVVSEQARETVDKGVSLEELFKDPEAYVGKTVMLGGAIINTAYAEENTIIETLEHPLDWRGRPKVTDQSLGRFLVRYDGFLDQAIYAPGRLITVVGTVMGGETLPLGRIDYLYPVIRSRELHLIERGYGPPRVHFGLGVFHAF